MILVRSPLRITLGGGGTDLPSYYREHEGFVISAAIDKYVYLNILKTFIEGIIIKYSKFETVKKVKDIQHPIVREVLNYFDFKPPHQIEIISLADIPSGTGLGSSGSFTTALIKSCAMLKRRHLSQLEIAEIACHIEINKLKEPIGKQDQFISSFGGITCFTFHKNDEVSISPLKISPDTLLDLQDNLILFFTGFSRDAGTILENQNSKSQNNSFDMINNLHAVKKLGHDIHDALITGNTVLFGELMLEHWKFKKKRGNNISTALIDEWYELAIQNGAIGGKVVGAGGGGFLMFYAHDKKLLKKTMNQVGLQDVNFRFDFEGTKKFDCILMFPVVILSGGFATRLYPITKNIPKSLISIAGKAFVIHQLEYLRKQGIKKIVFCLNHLGKMIENKIGDGKNFSMEITYSYDGLVPLGTGGAIVKALPFLGDNFFILYGDCYLPLNFKKVEKVYKSIKPKALMTVFKNDNEFDKSNAMFLNQKLILYNKKNPTDKMNYIDYGLSVVSASIFKKYANYLTFDLAEVYEDLSLKKNLAGLEVYDRFYEIGSHIGLKETESYLLANKKI